MKKIFYLKNYIKNYFLKTKFYSIFLIEPIKNKDWGHIKYTTSHFHKGEDYHKKFNALPGRKIIWNLEKKIINIFLHKKNKLIHLDFASGSGRVSKLLKKKVRKQYLLDSSSKMLKYAEKILKNSIIINKDFTKVKINRKFDLITAFRFFPNAEPHLRKKAIKFISKSLKKDGIFIFNNHRNFWSLPYLIRRLTFRSDGFGMTHSEVKKLVSSCKLKICDYRSIGLITDKEKSSFIFWSIIQKVENFLFKINSKHRLGYNIIYIIRKC